MGHVDYDNKTKGSRLSKTNPAWLKPGSLIGDWCNGIAGREDIVVYTGTGAAEGSAGAAFNVQTAEIELAVDKLFPGADPSKVGDFRKRKTQLAWPMATGAIVHEVGHARYSLFDIVEMNTIKNRNLRQVVTLLEETRIHAWLIKELPRSRKFLRMTILGLVLEGTTAEKIEADPMFNVSLAMLLSSANVDAGILEPEDVEELNDLYTRVFGERLMRKFRTLWRIVQRSTVPHEQALEVMVPVAKKWIELLPEQPEDSSAMQQLAQELMDALGEAADVSEIEGMGEVRDEQQQINNQEAREARDAEAREQQDAEKTAKEVFSKSTEETTDMYSRTRVVTKRPPTDAERGAAITIGKQLVKAKYHDRERRVSSSAMPPGRLNTRAAIQVAVDRKNRVMSSAQPWENPRRISVDDPNLKIGVMTDVSGSMNSAMEPTAVANFVLSEAGRRIGATVASVYFGNNVTPGLKPGERLKDVTVRYAGDGTERFDMAFKALDGGLTLLQGTGARLLVILSDLCYTGHEGQSVKKWTDRCIQSGVGVIVMPFDNSHYVKDKNLDPQVQVMKDVRDAVAAAKVIGQAGARALEAAGTRRA